MWPLSALASSVIRSSHRVRYRVTAHTLNQGAVVLDGLTGGTVTVDSKSQVRRTATLDLALPELYPTSPFSALSPLGGELSVEYGIEIPTVGTEWVPLIYGPIQSVKAKLVRADPDPDTRIRVDGLQVEVAGRSKGIADDRLTAPTQTIPMATAVSEIKRLILATNPLAVVVDATGGAPTVAPKLEIDKERWQDGIEKIADAAGLEVHDAPDGSLIIRPTPTLTDAPVWRVDAGEAGVLVSADLQQTRKDTYNAVLAAGQRSDGTPAVSALVVDDDPASPTRYGGPFGKKTRYFTSPVLTTVEACRAAGKTQLERVKGFTGAVELTAITNPALEGGDVIEVDLGDGNIQRHIIDKCPIPLTPGTAQSLSTRSVDLPPEQEQ